MNLESIELPAGDKGTAVELNPDGCSGYFLHPANQINKTFALSGPTEVVIMSSSMEFDNPTIFQ